MLEPFKSPLSHRFPHNSVYAFSENRVIDAFELEGLEVVNSQTGNIIDIPTTAELEKLNSNDYDFWKHAPKQLGILGQDVKLQKMVSIKSK